MYLFNNVHFVDSPIQILQLFIVISQQIECHHILYLS